MSVSCARAQALRQGADRAEATGALAMADLFCRQARRRAEERFERLFDNDDARGYGLAQGILRDEHAWLERGIV